MSSPAASAAARDGAPAALRAGVQEWLRAHLAPGADLRSDSRRIARGDAFVALPGRRSDGLSFLDQAAERGAAAALVDAPAWHGRATPPALPVLPVPGLRTAAAAIAADHYGDPSARLRSIGITGTNGKTSSCQWIARLLGACGQRCATLGTLGFGFPDALDGAEAGLTTPDAVDLQRLARRALDGGAAALAAEVSSIGLDQGRVDAFSFHVALFTNLTRDHLDYHADMAAYGAAKRRLFDWPTLQAVVLNQDDAFGRRVAAELAARRAAGGSGPRLIGFASAAAPAAGLDAVLHAESIEHRPQGLRFTAVWRGTGGERRAEVTTGLIGGFNVANLLGALGVCLACGVDLADAAAAASDLVAPAGRMQRVPAPPASPDAPVVVVDYAHTPDAIAQALAALRPLAQARGGQLCIVFGAGGDRDPGKRPLMAAAAAAGADRLVLTSDNPRGEPPEAIIDQLLPGLPAGTPMRRQADRAQAIGQALREAGAHDVILIAGKGHEAYQEIAGRRLPFSDLAVAAAALQERLQDGRAARGGGA
jgi:UDP-N-acetylmuramyl-tripeptide synthetase